MAKKLNVNTLAEMFAEHRNLVVLDGIGGKNPETGPTATTYACAVTDEVADVIGKVRTFVNNNWDNAKMFPNCTTDAEKLAHVPTLVQDNVEKFEAPPKVEYVYKLAARNMIARLFQNNPDVRAAVAKGGKVLTRALDPEAERLFLQGSGEKYATLYETEVNTILSATSKRSRRDGSGGASSEPQEIRGLDFDTGGGISEAAE